MSPYYFIKVFKRRINSVNVVCDDLRMSCRWRWKVILSQTKTKLTVTQSFFYVRARKESNVPFTLISSSEDLWRPLRNWKFMSTMERKNMKGRRRSDFKYTFGLSYFLVTPILVSDPYHLVFLSSSDSTITKFQGRGSAMVIVSLKVDRFLVFKNKRI